jgi:hypothetical protein
VRWRLLLIWTLLLPAVGCHTTSTEPLEADLRSKDHDLGQLRTEMARLQDYSHSLERELTDLRHTAAAKVAVPPEQAAQLYTLTRITLGRQTGGYNDDDIPGDEALQVVLEPRDPDGHSIKAPGTLVVQAVEIDPHGLKHPLCTWKLSPDDLRKSWRNGFLSTAYFVILPWKAYPTSEKLRITAQFILGDGRVFEADKDVTVHLIPTEHRKPLPPPEPADGPTLPAPTPVPAPAKPPEGEPQLPPPRKLEPNTPELGPSPGPSVRSTVTAGAWEETPVPLSNGLLIMKPIPCSESK